MSRVQEPQLLSPCILEPSPEQEKPWQRESLTPQMESSLCSPQLVKSPCSKEDPASVQFSSVAQSCPTLCDPMDCSTPGLPAHHQLPEFTQTYVHWIGDTIQPSHPLLSPSPPALNLSQGQGLFPMSKHFTSGGQSIGVSASTSVLAMNTQDWSPLGWTGWMSLQSKGLSRVFSKTTVQKHQFFCTQLSLQSNSQIHTWPLEKP